MSIKPRFFVFSVLAVILFCAGMVSAYAQETAVPEEDVPSIPAGPDTFYRGTVIQVLEEKKEDTLNIAGAPAFSQLVKVRITNGPHVNAEVDLPYGGLQDEQKLKSGDKLVVLAPNGVDDPTRYYIFEKYRLPSIYIIIGVFVALTIFFARWHGFTSLLGLSVSIAVLTFFVVPQIMAGRNPLFIILGSSFLIAIVSMYLAHGFSRRTSVALLSTLITITIAVVLSLLFVNIAGLFGIGSEEAFYLQTAAINPINLQGLLLGGIIIGVLGVLDDITTAQAAAVHEIHKANPALSRKELIKRGFSVGREHITSLVNTLALAYAGASFPALLLFTIYQRPFWVILNTEPIAEELIRTFVGSIALMCAVPITTALAAYLLPVGQDEENKVTHLH